VADVCIVCCDGLPDAISVTWPQALVLLCVVQLIRASLRYASKKYWTPLTKDLKLICTAAGEAAAGAALEAFAAAWEQRYPAIVRLCRAHWEQFTAFLAFPPEVRRVIYTTNLIESMNNRLRKVTRNRGQFPSGQAALKVLYLAVRNLEEFRTPNTGIRSVGRKQAPQAFTIYFGGRIPPHENRHDQLTQAVGRSLLDGATVRNSSAGRRCLADGTTVRLSLLGRLFRILGRGMGGAGRRPARWRGRRMGIPLPGLHV
jgi:hypothetical protein